jgi:rhodanese-related sulfurtransferase
MTTLNPISAAELKRKLDSGEAMLIDIRESDEHAREHIVGARLAPLSAIDAHDFDRDHAKTAVFHCKSGMRTQANAASCSRAGSPMRTTSKAASKRGSKPIFQFTPTAKPRSKSCVKCRSLPVSLF